MRQYLILFLLLVMSISCEAPTPAPTPVSPVATPTAVASPTPAPERVAEAAIEDEDAQVLEEAKFSALARLDIIGKPRYIEVSGVDIYFACKHYQYFSEDNTADFQNCVIHVDDAFRLFNEFEIYLPVILK